MRLFKQMMSAVVALIAGHAIAQSPQFPVAEARYQVFADEHYFDGVVEAVHKSTISAQTEGEIVELPFDVNDYVPKGEVVIRFDDTKQKARLDKAIADEVNLQARLVEAESRYQRNQRLVKDNAVSQSELEKSEADLKSARAQLESSRATLKEAREQWEYTVVRAPYAGVLTERFVEVGEHAQVGKPLGTGLSLERLRVEVQVPASYVQRIRENGVARIQTRDEDTGWVASEQITVFPYAHEQSHTFTVRARLPEGQHGLYPGMLVKVAFSVGEMQALVVPVAAIVYRSEVTGIYVVDADQQIRFRQIRVGRAVPGDMQTVLAGLQEGERVALDPVAAGIALKQQAGAGHE